MPSRHHNQNNVTDDSERNYIDDESSVNMQLNEEISDVDIISSDSSISINANEVEEDGLIPPHSSASTEENDGFLDGCSNGSSNIMVCVRVRPMNAKEIMMGGKSLLRVLKGKLVVMLNPQVARDDFLRLNRNREKRYAFDYAFDEDTDQDEVYRCTTKFLISGVFRGFNATVFAYGNTGAGKTYTMCGTANNPGIMVHTLQDLFRKAERKQDLKVFITLCYLEIYNENIKDLLGNTGKYLELFEDPHKGMIVSGITQHSASTAKEVMRLLQRGNRNRTTESTNANKHSSRSHAILQILVECKPRDGGINEGVKVSKLNLIDLAGSERASVTSNRGVRMIEGANINRSLLALANCINALVRGKNAFIPYRDSKLTRLLKDSLGGNCRTVMIANASPCSLSYEDTINTLKYANRAKDIKTKVEENIVTVNKHISEYSKVIKELRDEVNHLKRKLKERAEQKKREKERRRERESIQKEEKKKKSVFIIIQQQRVVMLELLKA